MNAPRLTPLVILADRMPVSDALDSVSRWLAMHSFFELNDEMRLALKAISLALPAWSERVRDLEDAARPLSRRELDAQGVAIHPRRSV